ncbi:MAG: OmpA family protein [SAR324 cluster bacterium]|nr:OmpA family protein [SAR324 cluster bacterium]
MQPRDIAIGVLVCLLILIGVYHLMSRPTEDQELLVQDQAEEIKRLTQMVDQLNELKMTVYQLEENLHTKEKTIASLNQQVEQFKSSEQEFVIAQREKEVLEQEFQAFKKEIERREQVQKSLSGPLHEEVKSGDIQITQVAENTIIRLEDRVLFDTGEANLTNEGLQILNKIGRTLSTIEDQHIQVEGHTDSRPISKQRQRIYPTNWELSVDRSAKVVRYLVEQVGVDPFHISAAGFGPYHPLVEENTPEDMQKNRRVEFILRPLEFQ